MNIQDEIERLKKRIEELEEQLAQKDNEEMEELEIYFNWRLKSDGGRQPAWQLEAKEGKGLTYLAIFSTAKYGSEDAAFSAMIYAAKMLLKYRRLLFD